MVKRGSFWDLLKSRLRKSLKVQLLGPWFSFGQCWSHFVKHEGTMGKANGGVIIRQTHVKV